MKLFLDTSALISVFDSNDKDHQKARIFWQEIYQFKQWREIIISDYIVDEIVTRIRMQIGHETALQVLNNMLEMVKYNKVKLIWIESKYFYYAKDIFERYEDQDFSFTDCTSFAICKDSRIAAVFAFDKHFDIFGGLIRYPR